MVNRRRLMNLWRAMHNRCYNPKNKSYADYGLRGIFVAPEWHGGDGFRRFCADMGNPPEGCSLDRRDNAGPYSKHNCRWATQVEQASNKRNNRHIEAGGETLTLAAWARRLGCTSAAILARIKSGMAEELAVTLPIPKRPNSRLTEAQVVTIRATYPEKTMQALALEHGVSKKTIMNVVHNKIFTDVKHSE